MHLTLQYLIHKFEGKQLYKEYIADTMMAIEYLWGDQVQLQTTAIIPKKTKSGEAAYDYKQILYKSKNI